MQNSSELAVATDNSTTIIVMLPSVLHAYIKDILRRKGRISMIHHFSEKDERKN